MERAEIICHALRPVTERAQCPVAACAENPFVLKAKFKQEEAAK